MKPSEFLQLAKSKTSCILTGYSKNTQPGASDKFAMDAAKQDIINTIDKASAIFFICDEDLYTAIALATKLENKEVQ